MKKTFFTIIFFVMYSSSALSMNETSSAVTINYENAFSLCRQNKLTELKNFLLHNPSFNINYERGAHKETLLHCAATYGSHAIVWYLLEECNANKMTQSKDGQTLFSKALCFWADCRHLKKLFSFYSPEELNLLCQDLQFNINWHYEFEFVTHENDYSSLENIKERLENKKSIHKKNSDQETPLHIACRCKQIPLIIQLLNVGADMTAKDMLNQTPYDRLNVFPEDKIQLFAIREAFNNGPCTLSMPLALVSAALEKIQLKDVERYIKQLYIDSQISEQFESPKAHIWKPVCMQLCTQMGHNSPRNPMDETQCLATIMILPKKTLTQTNLQLTFENIQ